MKYVIVGNGTAAVAAIEGIRSRDKEGEILLISKEGCISYSKPQLYQMLNSDNLDNIAYRGKEFYIKNNVSTILGVSLKSVDFSKKLLFLEKDSIHYDRLLIATGAKSNLPSLKGFDGDIYSFTNIQEANKLRESLDKKNHIVILGGGLIGAKLSEYLVNMGKEVTLIVGSKGVLSSLGDENISEILNTEILDNGVKLLLSRSVASAKKKDSKVELILEKEKIICDAIVSCKGVKPEISPFEKTELSIGRGIKVDDHMKTNIDDVYAAGDVAEVFNRLEDSYLNIPILPNAFSGGYCAGVNMSGGDSKIETVYPMNSLKIFDIQMITMGLLTPRENDEVLTLFDSEKKIYKKLVIREGKLIGAALIGDIDRAGILNNIIRSDLDISPIKSELLNNKINFYVLPKNVREDIVKAYTGEIK